MERICFKSYQILKSTLSKSSISMILNENAAMIEL